MLKKYVVRLSAAERARLTRLISAGKAAARVQTHARVLLKADQSPDGPAWIDAAIVTAFDVSVRTVERVREAWVNEGLDAALARSADPTGDSAAVTEITSVTPA